MTWDGLISYEPAKPVPLLEAMQRMWEHWSNEPRRPQYEIVHPHEYAWRFSRPDATHYDYVRYCWQMRDGVKP